MQQLYKIFSHWGIGGRIFFYSDPHFSDVSSYIFRNLITDSNKQCIETLDSMQISNINSVVHKNDTLIILGDCGNTDCIAKLKAGYKILITGNHDSGCSNYIRKTVRVSEFSTLADAKHAIACNKITHFKVEDAKIIGYLDNHLFDEVYDGPLLISNKLLLSHEPIENVSFCYNIHGHVHANVLNDKYHFNCCAEHLKYFPIAFQDILLQAKLNKLDSIHRLTINGATERKQSRLKEIEND